MWDFIKKLTIGLSLIPVAHAEFYKVEVTRVESNFYQTPSGLYIKTKYCYEFANQEEAILSYEQYSYDNKLIFSNGQTCDVDKLLK